MQSLLNICKHFARVSERLKSMIWNIFGDNHHLAQYTVQYFQSERFVEVSRAEVLLIRGQRNYITKLSNRIMLLLSDYNDTRGKYFLLYDDSPCQHSFLDELIKFCLEDVQDKVQGQFQFATPPKWLCCDFPSSS